MAVDGTTGLVEENSLNQSRPCSTSTMFVGGRVSKKFDCPRLHLP